MIRSLILGAVLASGATTAPLAQTPPPAPAAVASVFGAPRAYAGYSQPEIPATACRTVSPTQINCTIPAMTAGRYVVHGAGTSTAGSDASGQAVQIQIGQRVCGKAERVANAQAPWAKGTVKTLVLACEVNVLTDRPLVVAVFYGDKDATKDPKGPTVRIERLAWDGVVSAQPFAPPQH